MALTTTVTAAKIGYYCEPIDGSTFGASTHPSTTAIADMITRGQNYVNELNDTITQNMHDEAVLQICTEFVRRYNRNYLAAGAYSASGEKGASLSWSPAQLIDKQLREDIIRSGHKTNRRVRIGKLMPNY